MHAEKFLYARCFCLPLPYISERADHRSSILEIRTKEMKARQRKKFWKSVFSYRLLLIGTRQIDAPYTHGKNHPNSVYRLSKNQTPLNMDQTWRKHKETSRRVFPRAPIMTEIFERRGRKNECKIIQNPMK